MRIRPYLAMAIAAALALAIGGSTPPAFAADTPVVSVLEARNSTTGAQVLVVFGKNVHATTAARFLRPPPDSSEVAVVERSASVRRSARQKDMVVVGLPTEVQSDTATSYFLRLEGAKGRLIDLVPITLSRGAPPSASLTAEMLSALLRQDVDDSATVGGRTAAQLVDLANATGQLPDARFDAWANLVANSHVGTGASQLVTGSSIPSYGAASGVKLNGTNFEADFGGTGTATTVARADHNHNGTYVKPTDLGNGPGLTLDGTTFSVAFAGNGSATTAARSDHNHDAAYAALGHNHDATYVKLTGSAWSGPMTASLTSGTPLTIATTGSGVPALSVAHNGNGNGINATTTSPSGTAVQGIATPSSGGFTTTGVFGRSDGAGGYGVRGVANHSSGGYGVYGSSQFGIGVLGAGATGGNFSSTTTGGDAVWAQGDTGVRAYGTNGGTAVYGRAGGSTAIGLYGETQGSAGIAVSAVVSTGGGNVFVGDLAQGITNSTTTTDNLLILRNLGNNVARVDRTGRGFFNGGTQTNGADVAESMPTEVASRPLEPGDVLVISRRIAGAVTLSTESESTAVAGVYSTRPGVLLTMHDGAADALPANEVPCAIKGRVPTRCCDEGGAIALGDLLVAASRAGFAKRAPANPKPGSIVGKAMEELPSGAATILVLVTVQ